MSGVPGPSPHKGRWLVGLLLLLLLVGGYSLLYKPDWTAVADLDGWLLVALLVVSVFYLLIYTLSIWVLLRGMGHFPRLGRLYLAVTASMSTNYMTPVKAGIPIRLWLYKSILGIPVSSGGASVVIETALGLLIGVLLSLVGARTIVQPYDRQAHADVSRGMVFGRGMTLVWLVLLGLAACAVSILLLRRQWFRSRYGGRIMGWARAFWKSLRAVSGWALGGVLLLYLVRLAIRAFCIYLVLQDLGVRSSVLDLVFVQSISGVIGIVSMLPMGIGAKDVSLTVLMVQIGVPHSVALAAALIDRTLWTFVPLVVGIVSANILGIARVVRWRKANWRKADLQSPGESDRELHLLHADHSLRAVANSCGPDEPDHEEHARQGQPKGER